MASKSQERSVFGRGLIGSRRVEAGKALDTAQELWRFVLGLLPPALYLPPPGEEAGH